MRAVFIWSISLRTRSLASADAPPNREIAKEAAMAMVLT